jgi:hypothetical protein
MKWDDRDSKLVATLVIIAIHTGTCQTHIFLVSCFQCHYTWHNLWSDSHALLVQPLRHHLLQVHCSHLASRVAATGAIAWHSIDACYYLSCCWPALTLQHTLKDPSPL